MFFKGFEDFEKLTNKMGNAKGEAGDCTPTGGTTCKPDHDGECGPDWGCNNQDKKAGLLKP